MPAQISSNFCIVVDQTINSGSTITIANPGRTFTVIDVLISGQNGAVTTIKKNDNAGAEVIQSRALSTGRGLVDDSSTVLVSGDVDVFTDTDNVFISVASANVTRIIFKCNSGTQNQLVVT